MNTAEDVQGLVENTKIYPHKQLKMCQGLLKKYPVVCHLQMLKQSLELWSLAWHPFTLSCPDLKHHFQKKVINMSCERVLW